MNNEKLEDVYNGLCGVRNVLDWKPEISLEERIIAAEKAFNEASEALFQADKELASPTATVREITEGLAKVGDLLDLIDPKEVEKRLWALIGGRPGQRK